MEINQQRRNLLRTGSSVALGTVMGGATAQSTGANPAPKVVPLASPVALRLASFATGADKPTRVGVVQDNGTVVDVQTLAAARGATLSFDALSMLSLIAAGPAALEHIQSLLKTTAPANSVHSLAQVRLHSPIPRPQANIYCVGWNYLDHFEEGKAARADQAVVDYPKVPVFFSKGTQTMNGPYDPIPYDASYSSMIDWEAELAVVIGRKGRNIPEAEAMNYVYGYAAYNDTTARDVQQKRHSGQWFKGKSLDGHGPMGPWLVTAAGVSLNDTRIICRVNGVEKQNASYKQMYFKIPAIIAELSRGLTLLPGDIIATGTPSGVGFGRKPQEFLKPGDVMETEITSVGILRNTIAG